MNFDVPDTRRRSWFRRLPRRRLVLGAALVVVLAGAYFAFWRGQSLAANLSQLRGWVSRRQVLIHLVCCLVAAVLVAWPEKPAGTSRSRRAPTSYKLAAAIALLGYYNFGTSFGRHWLHLWEMFHYDLGSKYFPELGYDGLYAASVVAQIKTSDHPVQHYIRDLRTNQVVLMPTLLDYYNQVMDRFTVQRWLQFQDDHRVFLEILGTERQIRLDHGYNPTPTWTFVARLLSARTPSTRGRLTLLSLVDPLLLALMWLVLFRTYGSRTACLSIIVFGFAFASRFYWNGGAFLRLDWIVAVVVGVCMLNRQRFRAAGALFAYAAMVRVFPVLFLFGPAVVAVRCLVRRESARWALHLAQGFALSALVCFAAGAYTGRGVRAWSECLGNLHKHHGTWLTNNVGLANLVLYDGVTLRRELVDPTLPEPWLHWQEHMDQRQTRLKPLIIVLSLATLALIAAAAWRSPPDEAAVLGLGAVYATLLLTCYYWVMLILAPIRSGRAATAAILVMNAGLYTLDLRGAPYEMLYGLMSWALAALLLAWMLPGAWRTIRRRGADRLPSGVSVSP